MWRQVIAAKARKITSEKQVQTDRECMKPRGPQEGTFDTGTFRTTLEPTRGAFALTTLKMKKGAGASPLFLN